MTAHELRKQRLLAAGICMHCGKNPRSGSCKKCDFCKEKDKIAYYKRKESRPNLCMSCSGKRDNLNSMYCLGCRDKKEARRKERIIPGMCSSCNKTPQSEGYQTCQRCRDYCNTRHREIKDAAYEKYGGYICKWCSTTDRVVLSIDHVNNDGSKHRKEIGTPTILDWLKKNNYPPGFQILCRNCNWAKAQGRTGPTVDQIPPCSTPDESFPPYEVPFYLRG